MEEEGEVSQVGVDGGFYIGKLDLDCNGSIGGGGRGVGGERGVVDLANGGRGERNGVER